MLPQQQPPSSNASYRSIACRIGTHHACAESSAASAPIDVPVIYEACDCLCHPAPDCRTPEEGEPLCDWTPGSAPTSNFDVTGGQTR